MKNLTYLFLVFTLLGCNNDDDNPITQDIYSLKYTLSLKNQPNEIIYTQEYNFDQVGKVVSETFTNVNNPQYNHFSTFEYDSEGRVIKEVRNGEEFRNIIWNNNFAEVYNVQNVKISEFNFDGEILTDYKINFNTDNIRTRKLNYDQNQNIITIENETEVLVEYLNYNLEKRNPFHLIQSIGLLRIDYKPYFKNIFETEKVYPIVGDDFTQPLSYYNYFYEFDIENRVTKIEDELTLIYSKKFEYNQ